MDVFSTLLLSAAARISLQSVLSANQVTWISDRIEISNPISSFKRLKEGIYLFQHGQDPYAGAVYRSSPLLVVLFSLLDINNDLVVDALYLGLDLACAWLLATITKSRRRQGKVRGPKPWMMAFLFLFHPFNVLASIARSTLVFSHFFTLLALWCNMKNQMLPSMFALSLAAQFSLYPTLLLPPMIMMLYQNQKQAKSLSSTIIDAVLAFVGHFFVSTYACSAFLDSKTLLRFYETILTVSDLTPNVGLCWYFFIEMFDHFRPFFLAVFQLHIVSYVAPICIKFKRDPFLALTLIVGVISTFKSYPSINDIALFHSLVFLHTDLIPHMRYPLLSFALLLYSCCLLPTFHHLWLYAGSGNANFYYASTMVYGLANGVLLTDLLWAGVKRDFLMKVDESKREKVSVVQR